ncbi:hypothetical protein [Nesterenkonia xinjiangensis]|uniref:Uncharacterized protein n=1 Tax=Nesterenkonia xinjiangensis TaxID=225327 RepID=A0A7Z0GQ06_9MICC|nr:hypothetical protein [Nesterenkonia xinjiangensis]NYJ78988.1 hypothetical protein [Nesterenkonia xinjiangensis]
MSTQHLTSVARSDRPRPAYRFPATWPQGLGDLVPRRALSSTLSVHHMPFISRIAYVGMLAMSGLMLIFLLPSFLIYLTGLNTITQVAGLGPGIVGLLVVMASSALGILQIALVLKVPERLEWVRLLLTVLLAISTLEAVLRSWAYPSVIGMGLRWDLGIMAVMVLLLWLPSSNRWFTSR